MITMKMSLIGLGSLVLAAVSAFGFASAKTERADCPGKMECPLTGEIICKDQCPATDATRADCPGRIECPLTGELICKDKCPATADATATVAEVPSCCKTKP